VAAEICAAVLADFFHLLPIFIFQITFMGVERFDIVLFECFDILLLQFLLLFLAVELVVAHLTHFKSHFI
jgi:hypothetical protein